jgi:hypothetical protein
MSKHHPFPWTLETDKHGTFLMSGNYCIKRVGPTSADLADAQLMTTIPGLLMAAMRGHGWGDPLHIEAHPECTMCHAIRIAVGERTAERVLELAAMNSDYILELLDAEGASDEQNWPEVERFLGIAEGDPYCAELRMAGEYEGMDADIIEACSNA